MSLRSLGSLLTPRLLLPRGIYRRAQVTAPAPSPAAGMPPSRSLHSLRDFAVGDGAGAYGGVAAAALAGLVGILYFVKGADQSAAGEVVTKEVHGEEEDTKEVTEDEEAKKTKKLAAEETRNQGALIEAATKEHNGNEFSLEEYLAEMTEMAAAQKKARSYERSCNKKAVIEVTNSAEIKDEAAMKEETAMKARFKDWIKEYGKRYRNKEEKARRYELFKAFANMVDKATAQGGAVFVTNHTADWTEEECQCLYDTDVDWEDYIDHVQSLIDKKNAKAKKARRD